MTPKPIIVTKADRIISRTEELKYGKKYVCWLTQTKKIENKLKQMCTIYYKQCNKAIKSSFLKDATFKQDNDNKLD